MLALVQSFSRLSCWRPTHTCASPIRTTSAPTKTRPRIMVLEPSPPPVATVLARLPPPRADFFGTPSKLMRIIGLQSSSGPNPLQLRAVPDSDQEFRFQLNRPGG